MLVEPSQSLSCVQRQPCVLPRAATETCTALAWAPHTRIIAGAIQVTLKSPKSVSPYRIHNACKDVVLHFVQLSLVNRQHSRR